MTQRGLEGAQALVDRDQLDDGRPGQDQVLERGLDAAEGPHNLLHDAEAYRSAYNARAERHVGHQHASLQISVADDVEVEIVEVKAKVVAPYLAEQHPKRRRL